MRVLCFVHMLLNKLMKCDTMQSLPSTLSIFRNEFTKTVKTTSSLSILIHGVMSIPYVTSFDKISYTSCPRISIFSELHGEAPQSA